MKLRNKKTGAVFNFVIKAEQDYTASYFILKTGSGGWEDGLTYGTLEELHKEWEDYQPKEPLIKDEKIRKAVRAWAEANDIRYGRRCGSTSPYAKRIVGFNAVGVSFTIEFDKELKIYGDRITKDSYTIEELCGGEDA